MKKSLIIFITHNFRPVFSQTLKKLDSTIDDRVSSIVLFDDASEQDDKIDLNNISVEKIKTEIFSYDPWTKGHNFPIFYLHKNLDILEKYDYFWILENDIYFHGDLRFFIDLHDKFDCDLLVPEFGLRPLDWGWPLGMKGIKNPNQIGITAVIHRLSKRFAKHIVQGIVNNSFSGHVEALLPHLCIEQNFSIRQFVPDFCCSINTFKPKFISLIEKDILEGTDYYIENKMYHPIKL